MKKSMRLILFGILLAPSVLTAQSPEARIEAARQRVADAGIPVSLLETRVSEGRAKGIPLDRIAEAVERRAAALAAVGAAFGPSGNRVAEAELLAGADAVEAGISTAALRQVVAGARAEDRPVAIAVLTFLHREQGLPVDVALARVAEALSRGPDTLRELPSRAGGRGGPPNPAGRQVPGAAGRRGAGSPPAGVPGPGQRPDAGRPDDVGRPDGTPGRGRP